MENNINKITSVSAISDHEFKECILPEPSFLRIHYSDDRQIEGLCFKYEDKAYGMVERRGGVWDYTEKLWRFPTHDKAMDARDEIRKSYPAWPVLNNLDSQEDTNSLESVSFSLLDDGNGTSAVVFPIPFPYISSRSIISPPGVNLVKVSGNKKAAFLAVGDNNAVALVVSGMTSRGAKRDNKKLTNSFGLSFSGSKVQIKVEGWAVEAECDLSNPSHYILKPAQKYERQTWCQTSVPWTGIIRITRKGWTGLEDQIKAAKLEYEGDAPTEEITRAALADFATVPGWDTSAANGYRLHSYQKDGARFCVSRGMRTLVGDEMGVGKTAQAIAAVEATYARQILIVCPANARYVWEREIKGWGRGGVIQHITNQLDAIDVEARWRIATFDQLVSRTETWNVNNNLEMDTILLACPGIYKKPNKKTVQNYPHKLKIDKHYPTTPDFNDLKKTKRWENMMRRINGELMVRLLEAGHDVVIVDEAHRVKNRDAKRTESVGRLTSRIPHALLLTGTPMRNNEHEAAVLLSLIDHAAGEALDKVGYTIQDVKDCLQYFMIRRTKAEVLPELPPKTRQRMDIGNLDAEELGRYYAALDYARDIHTEAIKSGKSEREARHSMMGALEMARSHLGQAKVLGGDVFDLVREVVENKECVVVFSAHHAVSDALHAQLTNAGLKSDIVDGRTKQANRAKIEKDFQDGLLDVFIGGIQAAGEAITLHRADTVIFIELDWVPAALLQAEDRIHRIGQKGNCHVIHLIARLSGQNLDEDMIDIIGSKLERIGSVLNEDTGNLIQGDGGLKNAILDKLLGKTFVTKEVHKTVEEIAVEQNNPIWRPGPGRPRLSDEERKRRRAITKSVYRQRNLEKQREYHNEWKKKNVAAKAK